MLKITTPKLLIILVVLIGVFAISKFTGNKGRSKNYRTELISADTSKVNKILISETGQKTILTRSGDQWMVDTEFGPKKAMSGTIRNMISNLNGIKPSRIASRAESKWKDFQVDSTGTRVQLFNGSESLGDIMLGRFGVEGQRSFYTYVRLSGENDTYRSNDFMKMSISTKSEDFRNANILRLEKDSLNTISFNYPDSAIVLAKNDEKWFKDITEADSAATAKYISGLRFVTSKNFTNQENLGTPDLNVTYGFTSSPEIQLSAFKMEEGWVIQSSENAEEIWIDKAQFEKIFVSSSQF